MTTNMGLNVSHDEGETWEFRPLAKPWQYQRNIAPRADDSGVMFLTIGDSVPGSTGSLMRSRDFGETWEDAGLAGETKSTPWCIATNPADREFDFRLHHFWKILPKHRRWRDLDQVAARVGGNAFLALASDLKASEHFPEKWTPVFRRKCDQLKKPERVSDST